MYNVIYLKVYIHPKNPAIPVRLLKYHTGVRLWIKSFVGLNDYVCVISSKCIAYMSLIFENYIKWNLKRLMNEETPEYKLFSLITLLDKEWIKIEDYKPIQHFKSIFLCLFREKT